MIPQDLPPKLFQQIASHPGGVENGIREIEEKGDPATQTELDEYLATIDSGQVSTALADPTFRRLHTNTSDQDRAARVWAARQLLQSTAEQRRLELIRIRNGRPPPYCFADFTGLDVDADWLAPLTALEYDGSRYSYQNSSALMLSTTGASNSTYWLAGHLAAARIKQSAKIGLDPLLWGPRSEFPMMMYMMRVYGQPLDWDRIGRLALPEHGRWVAHSPLAKGEITEYAWIPRDGDVHLEVEEMPQQTGSGLVGARYLHAIYHPSERTITHMDGAVRVYSADEQRVRLATHLLHAGKNGVRAKAFRIDGSIDPADFSNIAASFYVWNADVQQYFRGGHAPALS